MSYLRILMSAVLSMVMQVSAAWAGPMLQGGWSSGGGEILKDSRNPWFLNNTAEIKYCIMIDETQFGASRSLAEAQTLRALEFWKTEFRSAVLPELKGFGPLKIATQTYRAVPCGVDVDLAFQFGVLTEEQRRNVPDPSDFGAFAIRTEYDPKSLKGRGFIYVSPNPGAVWSHHAGEFLYLTLVHELGHVFGLSHVGSYGDLMSEGFVEALLGAAGRKEIPPTYRYFSLPQGGQRICPAEILLQTWNQYFSAPPNTKCYEFHFQHQAGNELFGPTSFEVRTSLNLTDVSQVVDTAVLKMSRFHPVNVSVIWLPKEQQLFNPQDFVQQDFPGIIGPSLFEMIKQGRLKSNGESISVEFEQGRQMLRITVIIKGEVYHLL